MDGLTDTDRRILAFEQTQWRYAGAKESAIRELFDCSATLYYQELNLLLDRPAAYLHAPVLVKRLRRLRDERRDKRTGARQVI